jgi:hypothetical protein
MKHLCDDFNGININSITCMLGHCGLYLLNNQEST